MEEWSLWKLFSLLRAESWSEKARYEDPLFLRALRELSLSLDLSMGFLSGDSGSKTIGISFLVKFGGLLDGNSKPSPNFSSRTGFLQRGQLSLISNQRSIHFLWKMCNWGLQLNRQATCPLFIPCWQIRQTGQSSFMVASFEAVTRKVE